MTVSIKTLRCIIMSMILLNACVPVDVEAKSNDKKDLSRIIGVQPSSVIEFEYDDLIIAYTRDPNWCGSGGCTVFIIKYSDANPIIINKFPASNTPIYIYPSDSGPVLYITRSGGGIIHAYTEKYEYINGSYRGMGASTPPNGDAQLLTIR